MKIAVITARYSFAGVPLAQLRFARALRGLEHEVHIIVGHVEQGYSPPVIDGIYVRVLNTQRVTNMLIPLIAYLRTHEPDVVFSAEDHLNTVVLLAAIVARSKAKISCSSRVTPFDTYSNVLFTKRWILKIAMRMIMARANAMTCVSEDMVEQYKTVFNLSPHICVYNIVDDKQSRLKMIEPAEEQWFLDKSTPLLIAAGRLAPWKGFSDLIRSMKELKKTKKVRLMILGDGPLRAELEALIAELDLGQEVKLLGYVENTLKYFSRADIFVLSSYVEGLPNVLVEAMMCGCTPVSTNCPTGPREVLRDGKYGYLVPVGNPVRLALAIEIAIQYPIPKHLLNEAIRPFGEHAVIEKHFELLGIDKLGSNRKVAL